MSDVSDLKAELLVLNAENAELSKERDFYYQQVTDNGERAHEAIDALDAENAKLRELVRDMVDWAYISDYCDLEEQFGDRMRELGVDV